MFHNTTARPAVTGASFRYDSRWSSQNINGTELDDRIYVASPLDPLSKHCLFVSMAVVAVLGFVGNALVAYCLRKTQNSSRLRRNVNFTLFSVRLNYYIGSLVISDTLCPVATLPLFYLQIYTDVYQKDWHCKVERFFYFVFPCVTINNLLVIAVERLFASLEIRRFSFSTVQRSIVLAWLAALLITVLPVSNFKLVQYDLNATHFTTTCRYDNSVPRSRAAMLSFTLLEFILPSLLLIICNMWVMRQAWQKLKFVRQSVTYSSRQRHENILRTKGMFTLVAITFAFIIPYISSFSYIMYNSIAKPNISYRTDYIIRNSGGILVTANSAVNVLIYTLQLPMLRDTFKKMGSKLFVCKITSVERVAPATDDNFIPNNGIEAGNPDFNNMKEGEDEQLRNETRRDKRPREQEQELEERRTPPFRHVAYNAEEGQAAVRQKRDTSCQIVITADVH